MIQTMTEPVSPTTPLPPWLQAVQNNDESWPPGLPRLSPTEIARIKHQDMLDTFDVLFEPAMNATSEGIGISLFLRDDHRQVHAGKFMRWILDDPERKAIYRKACQTAAHLMRGDILAVADGKTQDIPDTGLAKLGVDARFKLMALADPGEFTTTTKIDVSSHQTIDITAAMAPALARAQEMQRLARERMASLPSQLVQDVGFRVVSDENLLETPDNASEEDD